MTRTYGCIFSLLFLALAVCMPVGAAVSVNPAIVEDSRAAAGMVYTLTVTNQGTEERKLQLSLGMARPRQGGGLDIDWSPSAAALASSFLDLAAVDLVLEAGERRPVAVALQSMPLPRGRYPVVSVGVTQGGLRGRLVVPFLLQPQPFEDPPLWGGTDWQDEMLHVALENAGGGFGTALAEVEFTDRYGAMLQNEQLQGVILPGQRRVFAFEVPRGAAAATVKTCAHEPKVVTVHGP